MDKLPEKCIEHYCMLVWYMYIITRLCCGLISYFVTYTLYQILCFTNYSQNQAVDLYVLLTRCLYSWRYQGFLWVIFKGLQGQTLDQVCDSLIEIMYISWVYTAKRKLQNKFLFGIRFIIVHCKKWKYSLFRIQFMIVHCGKERGRKERGRKM